jgi:hypothetical protein
MPKTEVFSSQMMLRPSGAEFRGSDLQRRYRSVLDSARDAPVWVSDKDGFRFVLAASEEIDFAWAFLRILDAIAQFHAAWARHHEEPPARWAAMTPFPFLAALDRDDVERFSSELLPYLEESVRRRDLEGFLGNLRAWESSAETYDDEAMLAQMNEPLDPAAIAASAIRRAPRERSR